MFRKITLSITMLAVLLLAGCTDASSKVLSYNIEFTTENLDRMTDLSLATRHVVERRLGRLGGNLIDYDVDYDKEKNETIIEIEIDNAQTADALNAEMTAPFTFEVRYLTDEEPQDGDIMVEGTGNFRSTGIQKEDIDWVIGEDVGPPLNNGRVIIGFTDNGVPKMQKLFLEQQGNTIGLFVRDRLTAGVQITDANFERILVIEGLPSADIAKIFADDMNVGIHMLFQPINHGENE